MPRLARLGLAAALSCSSSAAFAQVPGFESYETPVTISGVNVAYLPDADPFGTHGFDSSTFGEPVDPFGFPSGQDSYGLESVGISGQTAPLGSDLAGTAWEFVGAPGDIVEFRVDGEVVFRNRGNALGETLRWTHFDTQVQFDGPHGVRYVLTRTGDEMRGSWFVSRVQTPFEVQLLQVKAAPAAASESASRAWELGCQFGLACVLHERSSDPQLTVAIFAEARRLAAAEGITLADLPARTGNPEDLIQTLDYVGKVGRTLADGLRTKYGDREAALFEMAKAATTLLLVYEFEDADINAGFRGAIVDGAHAASLPESTWSAMTRAIDERVSFDELKMEVLRLHSSVGEHLRPPAGVEGLPATASFGY